MNKTVYAKDLTVKKDKYSHKKKKFYLAIYSTHLWLCGIGYTVKD